ncbi:MAG: hypothetical protein CO146_02605 [Candidatus Nealsonbacteria bacterium CG_4_9_14_3_um_filter_37_29]|uniref:Uncharacterized protein n=1 Tax=Candidatus Nealsonbacteria bacterium CG_4_9_14_3_um_filter_37_29 TaxID=1974696 RepID=A0A2M7Z2S9_9BACT|nr:MAG: hypothetical protein CO146_02605 [Candidatus Nealsonbacteria bacterium CG_4_9_14_3_um_filter_37_29]
MKITVSQQGEKLIVEFRHKGNVDNYSIDKAEKFLVCVDKLLKKHHTVKISDFRDAKLEFEGRIGMLTERVVRAIMLGLSF